MLIGIPREIKSFENRVGMTPASVREITAAGNRVLVERNADHTIGFDDTDAMKPRAPRSPHRPPTSSPRQT